MSIIEKLHKKCSQCGDVSENKKMTAYPKEVILMVKSIIIILAIVAVVGIFAVIWIFKKSGHLNVNSAQNEIKISRKDAHSIMDLLEALDELNGSD